MLRFIQWSLVAIHTFVLANIVWTLVALPWSHMWQAPWFILGLPDFPATILLILSWQVLPHAFLEQWAQWLPAPPFRDFANFWLPLLMYGIVGTLWAYAVPAMIYRVGVTLRRMLQLKGS